MIEPVFRAGETYAFDPNIAEPDAYRLWIEQPKAVHVAAADDGALLGTYYLKANQSGPGDHVCNCGYIVADHARGRGVARALCEHSQSQAIAAGFTAMQYNCVVATNTSAIALWQKLGFAIAGTLPGAFRHPRRGEVDAYVMYKRLVD